MSEVRDPAAITVRGDALAEMFECSQRQVQRFARDGVIPKATRGLFPLAASVRGWGRLLKAGGAPQADGPLDPERLEPFKRRAYYQGTQERMALRKQAGELIERADFDETLAAAIKALLRIRALRDYLERDGVPLEVVAMVEKHVDAICLEIYELLGEYPNVDAEVREVPA